MSDYFVYAIGAALVDTEIDVSDQDLEQLSIEKGMMTLVDEARQSEIKQHLADKLASANHTCGGSAGNSVIAASQFGAPTYMSCLVANDEDFGSLAARSGLDRLLLVRESYRSVFSRHLVQQWAIREVTDSLRCVVVEHHKAPARSGDRRIFAVP